MRYVAAYLLACLGGKSPAASDLEKILSSVGIEADQEKIKKIIGELGGKSVDEIISKGREKLSSMPAAGGAAAAAPASAAPAEEKKAEAKKEEKKKEESESEDEDMGFGLFD
ncbi:hypothetical protein FQA39_LY16796 [Lamprigera yunnana]|nr:hypothetical protein FQA39_LY16796 [Lamprigera yunnana]